MWKTKRGPENVNYKYPVIPVTLYHIKYSFCDLHHFVGIEYTYVYNIDKYNNVDVNQGNM